MSEEHDKPLVNEITVEELQAMSKEELLAHFIGEEGTEEGQEQNVNED